MRFGMNKYQSALIGITLLTTACSMFAAPLKPQDLQDRPQSNQKIRLFQPTDTSVTLQRKGPGKNNVVQGIALDEKQNLIYTTHVTGNPEKGAINRFNYTQSSNELHALDAQKPSTMIGHQGISVDPLTGTLFSSAGPDVEQRGWNIVAFNYTPNQLPNAKTIQVFSAPYGQNLNTMPSFSPNGQYLIVRGQKDKQNVVRVYNRNILTTAQASPLYEWFIDKQITRDKYPLQAMTTDGKYVYLLSGTSRLDLAKRLYVYTLQGQMVQKIEDIQLGRSAAKQLSEKGAWEPEGLTYNPKTKQLYLFYAVGESKQRLGRIYKINVH